MNNASISKRIGLVALLAAALTVIAASAVLAATIRGGAGNDTLSGTEGADEIYGLAGDDRITARGGNDLLEGASGKDQLNGGPDNDRIDGGLGRDAAQGSTGDDLLVLDRDENADYAYCGDGYDEARVSANDFIGDNTRAGDLDVVDPANAILGCEKIVVNGIVVVQVPVLPTP